MKEKTLKQKCIDAAISYSKVRSYKYRHKDLSYEQIFEHYKNIVPQDYASARLGEVSKNKSDLEMKIIKYTNHHDIDIQFEDGTIVHNKTYTNFKKGCVPHPKYLKCELVYNFKGKNFYLCTCRKCKNKHIISIDEMKEYKCEYCN
ncbi:MAG: hypothetical protein HDR05_12400 [Lachnospiraceae bacterium]|nr:hypothetical protein [Lachnospiraceae bacterium]